MIPATIAERPAGAPPSAQPPAPPAPFAPPAPSPKAFIERHPLLTYYALAFAISWGGVLLVAGGLDGMPGTSDQVARLLPLAFLAMAPAPAWQAS